MGLAAGDLHVKRRAEATKHGEQRRCDDDEPEQRGRAVRLQLQRLRQVDALLHLSTHPTHYTRRTHTTQQQEQQRWTRVDRFDAIENAYSTRAQSGRERTEVSNAQCRWAVQACSVPGAAEWVSLHLTAYSLQPTACSQQVKARGEESADPSPAYVSAPPWVNHKHKSYHHQWVNHKHKSYHHQWVNQSHKSLSGKATNQSGCVCTDVCTC